VHARTAMPSSKTPSMPPMIPPPCRGIGGEGWPPTCSPIPAPPIGPMPPPPITPPTMPPIPRAILLLALLTPLAAPLALALLSRLAAALLLGASAAPAEASTPPARIRHARPAQVRSQTRPRVHTSHQRAHDASTRLLRPPLAFSPLPPRVPTTPSLRPPHSFLACGRLSGLLRTEGKNSTAASKAGQREAHRWYARHAGSRAPRCRHCRCLHGHSFVLD
jgi:hypothetical protein